MDYYLKYYNANGRVKSFIKTFPTEKSMKYYVNKKKSEGCRFSEIRNTKPGEAKRVVKYDFALEKEIVSKKREYFDSVCIYALIDKDEVVYIGQSSDVMGRLSAHKSSEKKFTHFTIVERIGVEESKSSSYVNEREFEYIRRLRPKYNKTGNVYGKSYKNKTKEETKWF